MISLEADAGVLFIDPGDVGDDGEWAAYSLFDRYATRGPAAIDEAQDRADRDLTFGNPASWQRH